MYNNESERLANSDVSRRFHKFMLLVRHMKNSVFQKCGLDVYARLSFSNDVHGTFTKLH